MKRFLILALLVALTSPMLVAQQEEEPPIPPKRSKAAKVGAFGGFMPGWLFVDVNPINSFLSAANCAPFKDDGVPMWGGGGAAYIMLVPNVRVGGLGMSGTIKSTSLTLPSGFRRDAELHVGFGGVTVEYALPVVERFNISAGAMLGWGGIDIVIRENAGGNINWTQEWEGVQSGNFQSLTHLKKTMTGSYFVWIPSINAEYAILGWLGVRLGASYVGMSAPSWTVDDDLDLIGVPSDVSGKGFMINAGIFVGTF